MLPALATALFSSCDKAGGGRQTNANGLQYEFLQDEEGPLAKVGDFITLHFKVSTEKDSILNSTYKNGSPLTTKLFAPGLKGGLEEGLMMMSAGDSAIFLVSSDTLMKGQPANSRPSYFPPGSMVKYTVKMLKVVDSANAEKEQIKSISEFGGKKGLNLQKTASGLHYAITTPGSGAKAMPGDTIEVHYVGTLLDGGKEFDNSRTRNQPFSFPVGMGMVIPGWDEGLQLLPVGSKATLVIPSRLAYGERGAPGSPIGPNAALVFDVEVLKVKHAKAEKK
jgi:FKBP-type peptidyl-prolyl cis-trans isomerase